MLAEITPILKPGEPPDINLPPVPPIIGGGPIYPPRIWPPNGLPPLPPGWWTKPPDFVVGWPPIPPDWPIVIPQPPDRPGPDPPDVIYPPLPPSAGVAGKVLLLVWIVGVGYRWIIYHSLPAPQPPEAQPKK